MVGGGQHYASNISGGGSTFPMVRPAFHMVRLALLTGVPDILHVQHQFFVLSVIGYQRENTLFSKRAKK